MVFINASIHGAYVFFLSVGLLFLYGMGAYPFFEGQTGAVLEESLPAMGLYGFGLILIIVTHWWKAALPTSRVTLWGKSLASYGTVILLLGLAWYASLLSTYGMNPEITKTLLYAGGASVVGVGLLFVRLKISK